LLKAGKGNTQQFTRRDFTLTPKQNVHGKKQVVMEGNDGKQELDYEVILEMRRQEMNKVRNYKENVLN
jgi:uncharacterized protein YabE (DUF348 family)